MSYMEGGQWKETREEIEIQGDGSAVATKGPHKVKFAPNLNSAGAIEVTTADGRKIRSQVLGLSYDDPVTGKTVVITEVKDCVGKVIPPNQVIYEDAFTEGVKADIRYSYTKAGLEQDIILREQFATTPEDCGLSSKSTRLQVLTEFLDAPVPRKKSPIKQIEAGRDHGIIEDSEMDFSSMRIIRGRAFSLKEGSAGPGTGSIGRPGPMDSVPVGKQLIHLDGDGRSIMVEEVSLPAISKELRKLPSGEQSSIRSFTPKTRQMALKDLHSPPVKTASGSKPMLTASVKTSQPGFVLDYILVNNNTNNLVFQGDSTYHISAPFVAFGSVVIEGGTVIKFSRGTFVETDWDYVCKTAPYRPAVITVVDDNSVGETINGSTGNPTGYYADVPFFTWSENDKVFECLRVNHACVALYSYSGVVTIRNCQFMNVETVLHVDSPSQVRMHNCLIYNAATAFRGYDNDWDYDLHATHLTVHNAGRLIQTIPAYGSVPTCPGVNLFATNCLFSCVTNWGETFVSEYNATNNNASVFQTVAGGEHYLATNSAYRDVGTTDIGPELMADLARRTTYPPLAYTNVTFSSVMSFTPHAPRDTNNAPDLGYHYDPLDYIFGGCHANTNVTFAAGVAAGWFRKTSGWYHTGQGIHLADRQIASFDGKPDALCYWARCTTVQENDTSAGYGPGGITGWADQNAYDVTRSPEIRMRFTHSSVMACESGNHFRDDNGYLILRARDCEFYSGGFGGYIMSCFMTNCLLDRCYVAQVAGWPGNEFHWQDCTFRGREVYVMPYQSVMPASFKNCVFDGTLVYQSGNISSDFGYNAYLQGATQLSPAGSGNVVVTNFNWQTGPLGDFYLPEDSALTNAGSCKAYAAGLSHFTTQVDQELEGVTPVDMGYHYVAVDANGAPLDADSDGTANYLSTTDINANGIPDAWELENFGNLDQPGDGDYDGDGVSNVVEYNDGTDPNSIDFGVMVSNSYVMSTNITMRLEIRGGRPSYQSVLVNNADFSTANRTNFSSTNVTVNLPNAQGWHEVWVGLRGLATNSQTAWEWI